MNILFTSFAISQLKYLDYAFFVAKMSKMTFTRFGGQVWLDGGQVRQFRGRERELVEVSSESVEVIRESVEASRVSVEVSRM